MSYQAITLGVVHTIERVRRSPLVPERDLTRHAPNKGSEVNVVIRGAHSQFSAITGRRMT
jgi:hypothetical protein